MFHKIGNVREFSTQKWKTSIFKSVERWTNIETSVSFMWGHIGKLDCTFVKILVKKQNSWTVSLLRFDATSCLRLLRKKNWKKAKENSEKTT